jgi:hypothetical protein
MSPVTVRKTLEALQRFRRTVPRLIPFLMLGGCGYATTVTWTAPSPRPLTPRPAESVEVFAGTTPARPHVGIGIIEVQEVSGSFEPKNQEILRELKREAGEQGCDAISLSGFVNKGVGADVLINDFATGRQGASAACLVYTDAPGSHPADARIVHAPPH